MKLNNTQTPMSWLSNDTGKGSRTRSGMKSPIFTDKKKLKKTNSPINEINEFSVHRQSSNRVEMNNRLGGSSMKKLKSTDFRKKRNLSSEENQFTFSFRNTSSSSRVVQPIKKVKEKFEEKPEFLSSSYIPISRRGMNKQKTLGINQPNLSLANCADELTAVVKENLNPRMMLIISVFGTINAVIYLFLMRLGFLRSLALVLLESGILGIFYLTFWNYEKYPIDLVSLLGKDKMLFMKFGSVFVMVFYVYKIFLEIDFSQYKNSGNFERFFTDLFAYISSGFVVYKLAFHKKYCLPEKMKSLTLIKIIKKTVSKYIKSSLIQDLVLFASIYSLAILTSFGLSTYKNQVDSQFSISQENEILKPSTLLKIEIVRNSFFTFLMSYTLILLKIKFVKNFLCMEIHDITYNGENKIPLCFSLSRLNFLQKRFHGLDSMVEFHALSSIQNNRDMLEFLMRKQIEGAPRNSFEYDSYQSCWIQILQFCKRNFEKMNSSLERGTELAWKNLNNGEGQELGDYLSGVYDMFRGKTPERRLALENYFLIFKVIESIDLVILIMCEGRRKNNLAALNEGNHYRAMREELNRLKERVNDLGRLIVELEAKKLLAKFSTRESVCKEFRMFASFVKNRVGFLDSLAKGR